MPTFIAETELIGVGFAYCASVSILPQRPYSLLIDAVVPEDRGIWVVPWKFMPVGSADTVLEGDEDIQDVRALYVPPLMAPRTPRAVREDGSVPDEVD